MTTISGTAEQAQAPAPLTGRPDVNRRRMARLGWAFTAPALIVVAAVTIFPIVYSVIMSLSNVTVTGSGISLSGFTDQQLLAGAEELDVALRARLHHRLHVHHGAGGTGHRHLIALVLQRLTAGRGWMMALLLLPWSMITVINAELWLYIYNGVYGVADAILGAVGLGQPNILGNMIPPSSR